MAWKIIRFDGLKKVFQVQMRKCKSCKIAKCKLWYGKTVEYAAESCHFVNY